MRSRGGALSGGGAGVAQGREPQDSRWSRAPPPGPALGCAAPRPAPTRGPGPAARPAPGPAPDSSIKFLFPTSRSQFHRSGSTHRCPQLRVQGEVRLEAAGGGCEADAAEHRGPEVRSPGQRRVPGLGAGRERARSRSPDSPPSAPSGGSRAPGPTSRRAAGAPSALPAPALGSPQAGREELTGLSGPGVAEAGPSKAPTRDGTIAHEKQRRPRGPRSEAPSPALGSQGARTHRGLQRGARRPGQEEDALHTWGAPSPACGGPGGLARSCLPGSALPGLLRGRAGALRAESPNTGLQPPRHRHLFAEPLGPRWLGRDGVLFGAKGLGASRESGGWRSPVLRPWNARPQ